MTAIRLANHVVTPRHTAGDRNRCPHPKCATPSIRQLADEARKWFAQQGRERAQ